MTDQRRKTGWPRIAVGALAAVLLAPGLAWAGPPMWVARDGDSTVVIFGSVHVLPQGLNWKPKALDQAVARADDVWFEVPLDAAGVLEAQRESVAHGFTSGEHKLSADLSREGQARLARLCQIYGLSVNDIERMQPWYAEMILSSALYRQSGADLSGGVERVIEAEAPPSAARRAFETSRQQVAMFASAPRSDQLASLEETLRQIDEAPSDYQQLVREWMAGDVAAIDREAVAPLRTSAPRLYATLVARRNARWADSIIERLHGSGRTVVVVGVGHLVGEDGLPALLRARGVTVDGPD